MLVIATDELVGDELIGALRSHVPPADGTELMVVSPAVEKTAFHHALGDVDAATRQAEQRLEVSLEAMTDAGLPALGEVGDSDPLVAAEDALREFDADEVLVVAHSEDQARWFEDGLFERAQAELRPPVQMLAVRHEDEADPPHLVGIRAGGDGAAPSEPQVELYENMPPVAPGSLAGIVVAIVGTIAVIVLAATGPGVQSAGGAAQILIAMAVALINMAHVVGLTLLESVHARGGWQRFFRTLSLTATPLAIVANALITLLA